jgi:NAD-dependent dihydropyrimidine dehydrogenase PreA subunit
MAYFISGPCIDVMDMSCVDECPVDCIYVGGRKLYIQPNECIDCGACKPVCPVDSIYEDIKHAPEEAAEHLADNRRFFLEPLPGRSEPVGSPGGARNVGEVGADTELAAAAEANA